MRSGTHIQSLRFYALILFLLPLRSALGQQTVFNVPSADVMDKGKVYGEFDYTVRPVDPQATFTPRIVVGIGHDVEVGVNINGFSTPAFDQLDISPTIKWRPWKSTVSNWSFYAGDDVFFPVRERTYDAGNYFYASFAKEWKHGTRIGLGGYDFTGDVVAKANRAGGQFTLEQRVNNRWSLAAEWYTGKQANGYVNFGAIIKLTSKLTLYAAYQLGNAGVTMGNHQYLENSATTSTKRLVVGRVPQ